MSPLAIELGKNEQNQTGTEFTVGGKPFLQQILRSNKSMTERPSYNPESIFRLEDIPISRLQQKQSMIWHYERRKVH